MCKKTAIHCYCNSFNSDGTLRKSVIRANQKIEMRMKLAEKRYGYKF